MYTAIDLHNFHHQKEVERFLAANERASFFHSLQYFRALQAMPDTQPVAYVVVSKDNTVKALAIGELGLESKLVPLLSKRLLFYDAPLYEDIDAFNTLIAKLSTVKAGMFAQIRPFHQPTTEEITAYQAHGFIRKDHLNAFIPLENRSLDEVVTSCFKKDKRNSIRKAMEHYKLEVVNYRDVDAGFEVFYEMLSKLFVEKRHGLKSKHYFGALLDHSEGAADIVFACYNNKPVATQLYILHKGRLTAFYASNLDEHKDKQAGSLLIHHMIKTGDAMNCKVFDFGGGGNPNKASGTRMYKERFGTTFQNVGRFTLPKSRLYRLIMFVYELIVKKH